ncbi:MAG: hypothetical protein IJK22_00125 [Bacteroidales bacterium]|nr:hypothetical protein [Bacteroidales bacterium]
MFTLNDEEMMNGSAKSQGCYIFPLSNHYFRSTPSAYLVSEPSQVMVMPPRGKS